MFENLSFNNWISTLAAGVLKLMEKLPSEVWAILATGLVTVVTTIITQLFLARAESRKARREEERDARKRREDRMEALNEVKAVKLADVWDAFELARLRSADCEADAQGRDFPPPATEWGCAATSKIYGLSLRYFPEMRPIAYKLHVALTEYEGAVWKGRDSDLNTLADNVMKARTDLADSIQKIGSELQSV